MKAKQEKRNVRGYKVKDTFYNKAMKRAKKEGGTVANLMENVIIAYSYGLDIKAIKLQPGSITGIDILAENFSEKIKATKTKN